MNRGLVTFMTLMVVLTLVPGCRSPSSGLFRTTTPVASPAVGYANERPAESLAASPAVGYRNERPAQSLATSPAVGYRNEQPTASFAASSAAGYGNEQPTASFAVPQTVGYRNERPATSFAAPGRLAVLVVAVLVAAAPPRPRGSDRNGSPPWADDRL